MTEPTPGSSPAPATSDEELLGRLADDFAVRRRRGEDPTVDEYVARHPALAERIRNVFSAVGVIEQTVSIDVNGGERPGSTIGRYKLLERIGEGGFGVVYMAEQVTPVRRKVALKVLKPGMDSHQVLARFEAERQALAIMDHPNIARVFDAGATEAGRPYFVMELVKGVPITEFCDQQQLTPRARLELFAHVCAAVQHAHQKGIIHRDIKPSNVLVMMHDTTPVVKVIDFGVAKARGQELTEKTLFTGFAQLIGTPLYMSPEQAGQSGLDVDTRSDIYSLGVLLYELLTGTTPFDKERFKKVAQDEIRRIIREEEPPKPSTRLSESKNTLASISAQRHTEPAKLTKLVRGELDWIVMKALEKDRARRYETATGLASDVQRYLADEPVLACPPSTTYRLKKFARRNKATLVTASVIGIAVLFAVATFGWSARDRAARQAKAAAQVEMVLTEVDELERAQKWPEALAAGRRAEAVLATGEADAATARRVRERLKDLAFVDRLERISMGRSMTVAGKFNYVGVAQSYARAFREHGVDVEALAAEASIERLKTRPALAVPLALALDDWASAHSGAQGDRAGFKLLLAIARGIDPEPLRDRLRSTWNLKKPQARVELRRLAESLDVRAQPPQTLTILARGLRTVGDADAALRIRRDARAAYPADFWINFDLAVQLAQQDDHEGAVRFYTAAESIRPSANAALTNLSHALKAQGKLDEAIAACRRAIEIQPDDPVAYDNLGLVLGGQNKFDEAVDAHKKAIELDPTRASLHSNLGQAFWDQNKLEDAFRAFFRATELEPTSAKFHYSLGFVLHAQPERWDEAVVAYRTAIKLDPKYATAYLNLFKILDAQKKPDEAMDASDKLSELDPKDPIYARHFSRRGGLLLKQDKLDAAIAACLKAVELDPKNAMYHYNLSLVLRRKGRFKEAAAATEKAIELGPRSARILCELAKLMSNAADTRFRDVGRAVVLAKAAVVSAPPADLDMQTRAWQTLGWALYRAGDWTMSVAALERSMALQPAPKGGDPGQWFGLAMAYWQLGDTAVARGWYDRAVAWMEENDPAPEGFNRFRREAAELVGVNEQSKPVSATGPAAAE